MKNGYWSLLDEPFIWKLEQLDMEVMFRRAAKNGEYIMEGMVGYEFGNQLFIRKLVLWGAREGGFVSFVLIWD